jgi:hypothetical protein
MSIHILRVYDSPGLIAAELAAEILANSNIPSWVLDLLMKPLKPEGAFVVRRETEQKGEELDHLHEVLQSQGYRTKLTVEDEHYRRSELPPGPYCLGIDDREDLSAIDFEDDLATIPYLSRRDAFEIVALARFLGGAPLLVGPYEELARVQEQLEAKGYQTELEFGDTPDPEADTNPICQWIDGEISSQELDELLGIKPIDEEEGEEPDEPL